MKILTIACFCIVCAVICKMLEKDSKEFKSIIVLSVTASVFVCCVASLSGIIKTVEELFSLADINDMYINIIFKGLGICYITGLAEDYCRDCGENAIASQVQLAGRLSLLVISLPLFRTLTDIISELLR